MLSIQFILKFIPIDLVKNSIEENLEGNGEEERNNTDGNVDYRLKYLSNI